jgi:hypothetical protein
LVAAPEEVRQVYEGFKTPFQKIKPSWNGPILPKESVEKMLKVIDKVTVEDSGVHLSQNGNKDFL